MSVISTGRPGQAAPFLGRVGVVGLTLASLLGAAPRLRAETHANLQAVNADGTSAWQGTFPFTLRGVLLCGPDEMLDATPNFLPWAGGANQFQMGGQWQVVIQADAEGDRGGTFCWMGQNYGNQPWLHDEALSYSDEAWVAEILRLNHDPSTGRPFRAGDLVEVTANRSLFYGGKRNVNESHDIDPAANFTIRLLAADYGLPVPEVIALADLTEPGGDPADWTTWPAIFDPTRATGGERWQGMRVRLPNLVLLTTQGWTPAGAWGARACTVTDGEGRFFRLRHPRYSLGPPPAGEFDAVGILNQESGSSAQGTNGYELFVQQALPKGPGPELAVGLNVTISWPVSANTYQLDWRSEAAAGDWAPVTNAPAVIDGLETVILPPSSPQRYYQLRRKD